MCSRGRKAGTAGTAGTEESLRHFPGAVVATECSRQRAGLRWASLGCAGPGRDQSGFHNGQREATPGSRRYEINSGNLPRMRALRIPQPRASLASAPSAARSLFTVVQLCTGLKRNQASAAARHFGRLHDDDVADAASASRALLLNFRAEMRAASGGNRRLQPAGGAGSDTARPAPRSLPRTRRPSSRAYKASQDSIQRLKKRGKTPVN